ncbi:MAG TPA: helix-turn-helix domain-containing protein [Xanthobacteraceae bacterium]|nr:helix-turn-helix domain-containing protein [Xanthobacteraceae bacterium]
MPQAALLTSAPARRSAIIAAEQVLAALARHYRVTPADVTAHYKGKRISAIRQVGMYVSVALGNSLPATGKAFHRHHTTVLHAVRTVKRNQRLLGEAGLVMGRMGAGP